MPLSSPSYQFPHTFHKVWVYLPFPARYGSAYSAELPLNMLLLIADGSGSNSCGPFLAAVEDGDELQAVAPKPIRNDVASIGYDKFPGAEDSTRAAHLRVKLQEFNSLKNAASDHGCA